MNSKISHANLKPNFIKWCFGSVLLVSLSLTIVFQAMKKANISDPSKCYFVDDNSGNIRGARAQGWAKCAHFCEKGLESMEGGCAMIINNKVTGTDGIDVITTLDELRGVWPEIFKD